MLILKTTCYTVIHVIGLFHAFIHVCLCGNQPVNIEYHWASPKKKARSHMSHGWEHLLRLVFLILSQPSKKLPSGNQTWQWKIGHSCM